MLWISRTTYVQERLIYVFFDDGTFQQFDDTWHDGDPPNGNMSPPPGLFEPQRGFGKVWREGTGARVRERLGWATATRKGRQWCLPAVPAGRDVLEQYHRQDLGTLRYSEWGSVSGAYAHRRCTAI